MAVKLRLDDEDRARYGGPEWLDFDGDVLDDLDPDELDRFERRMDMSIWQWRHVETKARTGRAMRAACWMARQLSGDPELREPTFADFKIKPLKVKAVLIPEGDDAGPPDGSSASASQAPADDPASSSSSTESPQPSDNPNASDAGTANPETEPSPPDSPSSSPGSAVPSTS